MYLAPTFLFSHTALALASVGTTYASDLRLFTLLTLSPHTYELPFTYAFSPPFSFL